MTFYQIMDESGGGGYKLSGQGAKLWWKQYNKHPLTVVKIPVTGDYSPLKTHGRIFNPGRTQSLQ
jgi:hypothetical protein